jgi:hypothetical protein
MNTIIAEPYRSQLYTKVRHVLGAPIRSIELEDEQMDSILEFSIGDYSQYVQDWLIESQWTSLYNLNLDTQSLSRAFVTKSLDYENRYAQAYSKIVGLQSSPLGDWELKKDFITLVPNQQIYEIPAGREINELLWFTPATLNNVLFDPWSFGALGGTGIGGPGGFAQMGGSGSYFMMPAFDMLLRMQEINIQRRIIAGDLTYRMTALPEGKKAIHLMQTPGGKFDFGNNTLMRGKVWYWYYEVDGPDRDDCLKKNPDIIKLPSDVPFDKISWIDLNNPAQIWVRKWFFASAKETLAKVRGKFSGNIKTPDSELTMDYASLATEGKDEKTKLIDELIGAEGRLTRLRPEKVMEREALLAENLNKVKKMQALPRQIYVI